MSSIPFSHEFHFSQMNMTKQAWERVADKSEDILTYVAISHEVRPWIAMIDREDQITNFRFKISSVIKIEDGILRYNHGDVLEENNDPQKTPLS